MGAYSLRRRRQKFDDGQATGHGSGLDWIASPTMDYSYCVVMVVLVVVIVVMRVAGLEMPTHMPNALLLPCGVHLT